jgi:hypothetical protein
LEAKIDAEQSGGISTEEQYELDNLQGQINTLKEYISGYKNAQQTSRNN